MKQAASHPLPVVEKPRALCLGHGQFRFPIKVVDFMVVTK